MADHVAKAKPDPREPVVPDPLLWVKDAPMFIDDDTLARFYDAVVRPAFKEDTPLKIKISEAKKKELEGKLGGKAKFGLSAWISHILGAEVEVSAEGKAGKSSSESSEQEITLEPISTPQRQLVQLAVFYLLNQSERILYGDLGSPLEWQKKALSAEVPALVFLDLPPGIKLVPMAAEFENGKVVTLFKEICGTQREPPPGIQQQNE